MSTEIARRRPSKEEIIAAIQACAAKLGRAPKQEELKQESGIGGGKIFERHFGNYTQALKVCGLNSRYLVSSASVSVICWSRCSTSALAVCNSLVRASSLFCSALELSWCACSCLCDACNSCCN